MPDLLLKRSQKRMDGIFGKLLVKEDERFLAFTLERAYPSFNCFEPKIPPGVYKCVRGTHALHNGIKFVTFEITGVDGHFGLLFHVGNFNRDSNGCVLQGLKLNTSISKECWLGQSKEAFAAFMKLQENVDEFELTVS